ncbi:class I tRNA ligase family protein [Patescibacteria group bacterium]|nr:class I tRNA ligase family protein [Patescibacteria group bacterium]
MPEMPKAYNPREVEDKIYKKWEESGAFNPDNLELAEDAEKFSIAMPPPNATGVLHLGHASMLAYEDLMIRYNRMKGKRTLWLPGTDHAAIATQTRVEKIIAKEGKTKYDLGREKFLERVKQYIEDSRHTIKNQTKKMGSSCDWSRERYTLDDGLSRAVREVFVKMYNDGLIYKGDRIVNWCPRCESTLADDEVEHKDQKANLYYFKYQKDFPITIATTRPETKLGDTAVAVNPKDKRYKKYINRVYRVDLGNGEREIKIIADREVDMDFGTGALGVTPAHSMADWQMAQKNNLPIIKIIGEDGKMNDNAGKGYKGLTVLEAREKFTQYLEENKLIEKVEEVDQSLSICYRCDTPIEPLPSKQWFVAVDKKITIKGNKYFQNKSLKDVALEVVRNKEIKIIPERFEKTYFNWMENLHDWCISRQLWFGHRMPVWYKSESRIKNQESRMKITFIRHCQSEGNAKDTPDGRRDSALTKKGEEQAKEIAKIVQAEKYDAVFSSTLKRAKQTANIIFGEKKIIYDDRLVEIDFGDLTGSRTSELDKFREAGFPNGEKYTDVAKRVKDFLEETEGKYQGKHIAIVAHSGVWKVLEHIINNKPLDSNLLNSHADLGLIEYEKINSKFQIPNSKFSDEVYVGVESPKNEDWTQDSDTLDTWFSSGLWTFSTLLDQDHKKYKTFEEWVANSPDLKKFHPMSVMETGYDILFFWVARMILMTTYATGEVPFENVYLHGMVRDKHGRKMSKSLGNGIDPIEMIEKYGTDALRLSMIVGSSPGNDLRIYEEKIEGYRNFVNKLWNISRYIIPIYVKNIESEKGNSMSKNKELDIGYWILDINYENLTLADKWILGKLSGLIEEVTSDLDNCEFSQAGEKLRDFIWSDFADWYLEISKIEIKNNTETKNVKDIILAHCLKTLLKLLHPFTPFVTEEIWSKFKHTPNPSQEGRSLLMTEKWPKFLFKAKKEDIADFNLIKNSIIAIRNLRAENKIEPAKKIKAIFIGKKTDLFKKEAGVIKKLGRLEDLVIESKKMKVEKAISTIVDGVEIHLPLEGLLDFKKELERIEKEIKENEKKIIEAGRNLANKNFTERAPKEIVEEVKEKLKNSRDAIIKLEEKKKLLF